MKLPKNIKIGGYTINLMIKKDKLKFKDEKGKEKRASGLYLSSNGKNEEIIISTEQTINDQKETLLHEILHHIDYVSSGGKTLIPEDKIDNMAQHIYAFIKQNEKVIKWIQN